MTPAMGSLVAAVGALWIAVIMWDAFEAIVLPRRVTRRLRPARMFYRMTWRGWSAGPRPLRPGGRRETLLRFYGQIGRAAGRGRGENSVVAGSFKKKNKKTIGV